MDKYINVKEIMPGKYVGETYLDKSGEYYTLIEKRQNLILRDEYNRTLINCRDILGCYSIELREKVLLNYLTAYNVLCNDCARGRLIYQLREEKIL